MSWVGDTRGRRILLAAPPVLAVLSGTAFAASPWSTTGSGVGAARSGGITAPGAPTVPADTVTSGNVAVSWSGATGPTGATLKYFVERMAGTTPTAVCASTFVAPITAMSCTDAGVANGTYTYRVTARLGADWENASAGSSSVTVAAPFTFTAPTSGATTDRTPTFVGKGPVGATATVRIYTGTNTSVAPVRTLTAAVDSSLDWTVSVPSNNGSGGRLVANTGYTATATDGTTSVSVAFTTNNTAS